MKLPLETIVFIKLRKPPTLLAVFVLCSMAWPIWSMPDNPICHDIQDSGPCGNWVTRYFYHKRSSKCRQFFYGGCEGSRNRFTSLRGCQLVCEPHKIKHEKDKSKKQRNETVIPRGTSPPSSSSSLSSSSRSSSRPSYLPSSSSSSSLSSARRGTETSAAQRGVSTDRIISLGDNKGRQGRPVARALVSDVCMLTPERGPCQKYTVRWHYNSTGTRCERFWYGGCQGNGNNFGNKTDCLRSCDGDERRRPTAVAAGCRASQYGCCSDQRTIARGPNGEGCPDRERLSLVGGCGGTRYGCCADGVTGAGGPRKEGCPETRRLIGGCAGTRYGCCADLVTSARGHNKEGCPETRRRPMVGGCAGTRYGCCRDGVSYASGENRLGCPENPTCNQTRYGCCRDGRTNARGPNREGCPESRPRLVGGCAGSRYGCCPDGMTGATGENGAGCPEFDPASCGLAQSRGSCSNWTKKYYFDSKYSTCRTFWYGGCKGNANRFASKEDCESKCVTLETPAACRLPNVTGRCRRFAQRYFFNHSSSMCERFTYGGCGGNRNNFRSMAECRSACNGAVAEQPLELRATDRACASNPCQNGFTCQDYSNGTYDCSCNPDWGETCSRPPRYWCFSDSECGRDLKCVRERECRGGSCHVYARCSASSGRYVCDRNPCPSGQDCVNDASQSDGYFCVEAVRYRRPQPVVLGCSESKFGCCTDQRTPAAGPGEQGCPVNCQPSRYGCCPDGMTVADADRSNCDEQVEGSGVGVPCERTAHGCCDDGVTIRGIAGCPESPDEESRVTGVDRGRVRPKASATCSAPVRRALCIEKWASRYRFNPEKAACEFFWWGGCGRPDNVFNSSAECEMACANTAVVSEPDDDGGDTDFVSICDMPQDRGPCRGNFARYYYNTQSRSCERFSFGGCQGNENNFQSLAHCQRECMGVVTQPETTTTTTEAPRTVEIDLRGPSAVYEGREIKIVCTATGPSNVNLEWFKNGNMVSTSDSNMAIRRSATTAADGYQTVSELVISRARLSDSGPFYCRVGSQYSTLSVEVRPRGVEVRPTPVPRTANTSEPEGEAEVEAEVSPPHSVVMEANTTVEAGSPIVITCMARGERRPERLDWFHRRKGVSAGYDIRRVRGNSNDPRVLVEQLTVPQATQNFSGVYHCRSRPYGDLQNVTIRVQERRDSRPTTEVTDSADRDDSRPTAEVTDSADPNEICYQPKKTGFCRAAIRRFYFDSRTGACERFTFGGCDANLNNFQSKDACERRCSQYLRRVNEVIPNGQGEERNTTREEPAITGRVENVCELVPHKGGCDGYEVKYYYSTARRRCERFVYTGCQGNGNRFDTEAECQQECVRTTNPPRTRPTESPAETEAPRRLVDRAACSMSEDRGRCSDWEMKWYFDNERQVCRRFWYGGCGGNENRFENEEGCRAACVDAPVATEAPRPVSCYDTRYGCCDDGVTTAVDRRKSNCRETIRRESCNITRYGCCDDGVTTAVDRRGSNCPEGPRPESCYDTRYGCCDDGVTTAMDRRKSNCRETSRPESCYDTRYGCCDDGVTTARDSRKSNCRETSRPESCYDTRYGCCDDGVTTARDRRKSNCRDTNVIIGNGQSETKVMATPGTNALIRCTIRGQDVMWYRDGFMLRQSPRFVVHRNRTLELRRVTDDMAGVYSCRANNNNNLPQLQRFRVQVSAPITIVPGPALISVTPAVAAYLYCQAEGTPTPRVTWSRGGRVLQSNSQHRVWGNGTLVIYNVGAQDAGEYMCTAENGVASAVRKEVTIRLKETIEATIRRHKMRYFEGETIHLRCLGSGFPTPVVTWEREGRIMETGGKVTVSGGELTIQTAAVDDAGVYKCIASNDRSSAVDTTSVQIKFQNAQDKCMDSMQKTKCSLIVQGRLCGFRVFGRRCCESCRRAGML